MGESRDLLMEHVARFNEGVATGDFTPMLERFADDAELVFEGVPAGPFQGKPAMAAAYRNQPPTDQIDVLDWSERDGVIEADYAWRAHPNRRAGSMSITTAAGRITGLVVRFG